MVAHQIFFFVFLAESGLHNSCGNKVDGLGINARSHRRVLFMTQPPSICLRLPTPVLAGCRGHAFRGCCLRLAMCRPFPQGEGSDTDKCDQITS